MPELSSFEFVAGIASIIGVVIVLVQSIHAIYKKYTEAKHKANINYENELNELKQAGNSVSARTDLGFYVLLGQNEFNENVSQLRDHRIVVIFAVLLLLFLNLSLSKLNLIFLVLLAGIMIYFAAVSVYLFRLEALGQAYATEIMEIWKHPINKRTDKNRG